MPIRHEDKEFIQALALFGAVFGACLGIFAVTYLSDSAHQDYSQQTENVQNRIALTKLQSTVVNPNNPIADENVLNQLQQQIDQAPAPTTAPQKSFWVHIPQWGYWGLCTGGLAVGAISGYSAVWVTGWTGSVFVMACIRFLYKTIRKIAPNSNAAKRSQIALKTQNATDFGYQRDDGRVLPVLVKLLFLLCILLAILSAAIWHLTAV
jgi:hypothetical protein